MRPPRHVLITPAVDTQLQNRKRTTELSRLDQLGNDAVARLASIHAPTGDIDQLLAEIEVGRSLR